MWPEVQAINAAKAARYNPNPNIVSGVGDDAPWFYVGDGDIWHGGIAVKVNRLFGYAECVEVTDLNSATGDAAGLALIEKGTVILDRLNLRDRRNLRSAMETVDITMAGLIADYPGDDRWKVMAELARAKWIYGQRDISESLVVRHDPKAAEENDPDIWKVDYDVAGREGLNDEFLAMLD